MPINEVNSESESERSAWKSLTASLLLFVYYSSVKSYLHTWVLCKWNPAGTGQELEHEISKFKDPHCLSEQRHHGWGSSGWSSESDQVVVQSFTVQSFTQHYSTRIHCAILVPWRRLKKAARLRLTSVPHPSSNVSNREESTILPKINMTTGTQLEIPKVVIVVFGDTVSKEKVEKYENDVIANGGEIKDRYYKSPGGINGFSAIIKFFDSFKTFRADDINYIEGDKIVTINT